MTHLGPSTLATLGEELLHSQPDENNPALPEEFRSWRFGRQAGTRS